MISDSYESDSGANTTNKADKFSQSKIKSAVSGENDDGSRAILNNPDTPTTPATAEYEEMQVSMMNQPRVEQAPTQEPVQDPPSEPQYQIEPAQLPQEQPQQPQGNYEGYSTYQPISISPDTMSEVAEQVVAEKLGAVTRSVDKLLDSNVSLEAQMKYAEDRIKRLEKIIDALQLSLLQKVGEYVSNVSDMKTELAETQKTFKAMVGQKDKSKQN